MGVDTAKIIGEICKLAAEYGPFSFGVIVGILINMFANSTILKINEAEKKALRDEKAELLELIKAKDSRIEKLHDKVASLSKVGG